MSNNDSCVYVRRNSHIVPGPAAARSSYTQDVKMAVQQKNATQKRASYEGEEEGRADATGWVPQVLQCVAKNESSQGHLVALITVDGSVTTKHQVEVKLVEDGNALRICCPRNHFMNKINNVSDVLAHDKIISATDRFLYVQALKAAKSEQFPQQPVIVDVAYIDLKSTCWHGQKPTIRLLGTKDDGKTLFVSWMLADNTMDEEEESEDEGPLGLDSVKW